MDEWQSEISGDVSLADYVYNRLKDAILCGEIKAGQRLKEIPLSHELGVSRTPVRKAIRRLVDEQFVVAVPGCGAKVSEISKKSAKDALEAYRNMEHMAWDLIFDNYSKMVVSELKNSHDNIKKAVAEKKTAYVYAEDCAFHEKICTLGNNMVLVRIQQFLESQIKRYKVEFMTATDRYKTVEEAYGGMIKALENNDREMLYKTLDDYYDCMLNNM